MEYQKAKSIVDSAPHWHQRFEIYPGIITPGSYDPNFLYDMLNLPKILSGKRALDIGGSDGFFSMKLAQAGAEVVCVDYREKASQGFAAMESITGLRFNYIKANIFELSPATLGKFDIILFLGILYHLPDMLKAFEIIHSLAKDLVYVETHTDSSFCPEYSAARYYVSDSLSDDITNFWSPNPQCLRDMLIDCAFDLQRHESWGDRIFAEVKANRNPVRLQKLKIAYSKSMIDQQVKDKLNLRLKLPAIDFYTLKLQASNFYQHWRLRRFPASKYDIAWRHDYHDARLTHLEHVINKGFKALINSDHHETKIKPVSNHGHTKKTTRGLMASVKFVDDTRIEGLVLDIDDSKSPRFISVYINDFLFCTLLACELVDYRKLQIFGEQIFESLKENLNGSQILAAGFSYIIPDYASSELPISVVIKDSESGIIIFSETRTLQAAFKTRKKELFHDHLLGRLKATGLEHGRLSFEATIDIPEGNADLIVISKVTGEVDSKSLMVSDKLNNKIIQLQGTIDINDNDMEDKIYLDDLSGTKTILPSLALYVPPGSELEIGSWHFPSGQQMRRVMGFADRLSYYFDGFAGFKMLDAALREFTGKSINQFESILDWGCGCGRVSQHLLRHTNSKILGVDIDPENILWCEENLTGGEFTVVDLMPPTNLKNEYFDFVFGISIFTHLSEVAQDAWLQEIKRVMKPGGIALFTIHSEHSFYANSSWVIPPSLLREFYSRGISDATIGNTLDAVVGNKNFTYYRETWHSHEYINRKWGSIMRLIGIDRAAHLNYQDLVVLRNDFV